MADFNKRQEKILKYLRYPWLEKGLIHKSPYITALIEARILTKRNKRTGKKLKGEHGCWMGALGYMVLIDHIGNMFLNDAKKVKKDGSKFEKALRYFTNLKEEEISALYSLRCSFAHNFSLFNKNCRRLELQHYFGVTSGSMSAELIIFPSYQWDGLHKNKSGLNKTIINLELLGDLVENMHKNIIELVNEDNISFYDDYLIRTFIIHK